MHTKSRTWLKQLWDIKEHCESAINGQGKGRRWESMCAMRNLNVLWENYSEYKLGVFIAGMKKLLWYMKKLIK